MFKKTEKFASLVLNNEFDEASEMLQDGFDIDSRAGSETTLHMASRANPQAVSWLIDNGCTIDIHDISGNTPLMIACGKGGHVCESIAASLLDANASTKTWRKRDRMGPLELAAKRCTPKTIERIISEGAPVNGPTDFKQTAAMVATRYDNAAALSCLIESGADITLKCRSPWAKGLDCIAIAKQERSAKCLKILNQVSS